MIGLKNSADAFFEYIFALFVTGKRQHLSSCLLDCAADALEM